MFFEEVKMIKQKKAVSIIFFLSVIAMMILIFILFNIEHTPKVTEYPFLAIVIIAIIVALSLSCLTTGLMAGKENNAGKPLNSDNIQDGDYEIQFLVKDIYRIRDKSDAGTGLIIFDYARLFSGLPAKGAYPDTWVIVKVETRRTKIVQQVAVVTGENKGDR